MTEKRVVLVKPGDMLLIGNLGTMPVTASVAAIAAFREAVGVEVALFEADIDIDLLEQEDGQ